MLSLFTSFNIGKWDLLGTLFFFRNLQAGLFLNDCLHHFWSLSIEEQFYLGWPLLMILFKHFWLRVSSCVAVVVLTAWGRAGVALWGSEASVSLVHSVLYFDYIATGCLVALFWHRRDLATLSPRVGHGLLALGMALVGLYFASAYVATAPILQLARVLNASGIALCVFSTVTAKTVLHPILNAKPIVAIGLCSYSVYIWQQFVFWPTPRSVVWHFFPANMLLLVVVSALSYHLLEKGALRWRRAAIS